MKQWIIAHKLIAAIVGAVVVIGAVVGGVLIAQRDAYRTVQVYHLDGRGEVARSGGIIDPYVNMMLQSGDHVKTFEESWLYMNMDEDKYVLAEPESSFSLIATGTKKDSKTKLDLETGALVNHITNPLSENSSYEVTTPNSVMAVRGTSFRVFVWFDEDEVSHTIMQMFEGTTEVHLVYPDGSISEEGRLFSKGTTVAIWGNAETSDYEYVIEDIDFINLEIETLEFLKIGARSGEDDYTITVPDLDELIRLKKTYFDVVFMTDENTVFGTQSVLYNHEATEPTLKPTPNGHWDYDFKDKIFGRTEIYWVEE